MVYFLSDPQTFEEAFLWWESRKNIKCMSGEGPHRDFDLSNPSMKLTHRIRMTKRTIEFRTGTIATKQFLVARTTEGYTYEHAKNDCAVFERILRHLVRLQHKHEAKCAMQRPGEVRTEYQAVGKLKYTL